MKKWLKYIPILVIIALMIISYFAGWTEAFDFERVRYHHVELTEYVNNNPISTPLIFIGAYIFISTLSIPVAIFLSLIGGFLFSQPWCTIYVVTGATIGATLLYLAARTALAPLFKRLAGPRLAKMAEGFKKNPASYILFMRISPLFPFWLVNIAPAFFNIRLWTYLWTTVIGVLPGAFILTTAGRGLNSIFEQPGEFSLASIFTTQMKIALTLVGIFALVPIIIRKIRERKKK